MAKPSAKTCYAVPLKFTDAYRRDLWAQEERQKVLKTVLHD
jgi:hypothetical protein